MSAGVNLPKFAMNRCYLKKQIPIIYRSAISIDISTLFNGKNSNKKILA